MPLSVIDLYRDVLPKTNCGDCGFATCMAFASMVVAEQHPLSGCPYIAPDLLKKCEIELQKQYADKKWTKRDLAADALQWARSRAASMEIADLPERIGGRLVDRNGKPALRLPYFTDEIVITKDDVLRSDGSTLTRWEQVFVYNHMAQGGSALPTGVWKSFAQFPNTVSKVKSMESQVEAPLIKRFAGRNDALAKAADKLGGEDRSTEFDSADLAVVFRPLPRVPILLMAWDASPADGFDAEIKLLFDETVVLHLDLESIVFLSERLCELLCEADQ